MAIMSIFRNMFSMIFVHNLFMLPPPFSQPLIFLYLNSVWHRKSPKSHVTTFLKKPKISRVPTKRLTPGFFGATLCNTPTEIYASKNVLFESSCLNNDTNFERSEAKSCRQIAAKEKISPFFCKKSLVVVLLVKRNTGNLR